VRSLAGGQTSLRWDPITRSYINPLTGEVFGPRRIIEVRDRWLDSQLSGIDSLAVELLIAQQISLAEWQRRMAAHIRNAYIIAYGLANGGLRTVNDGTRSTIGPEIKKQLTELRTTGEDIYKGYYHRVPKRIALLNLQLRARCMIESVRHSVVWP
jgi:hypothetical protein